MGASKAPEAVVRECVDLIRERIGPVAAFKVAIPVNRLPKTRSGKILRGIMKRVADGQGTITHGPIALPTAATDFLVDHDFSLLDTRNH